MKLKYFFTIILFIIFIPKISFATIGDSQNEPAISCLHIKKENSNAKDGKYWIKSETMTSAKKMYCDMTTAGGGWMLLFQRRVGMPGLVWENYNNTESCGNNLNEFLQNDCGSINNIAGYRDSYSSDVKKTLNENSFGEYLFLNYNYRGSLDSDDAYRIKTRKNIFPNQKGLFQIKVQEICDINGDNCDNTEAYWLFSGDSYFSSGLCNGIYISKSKYKGNYGYCHNGLGNYSANSLFGNRSGYNETKLWNWEYNSSKDFMERVFIKWKDPIPTDIILSNNTFDINNSTPINIGTLSSIDKSIGDNHTYSFTGVNNDNSDFNISGNTLILNNKNKDIYNIEIRTTDNFGQYFDKLFVIKKTGLNLPGTENNPIISCQKLKNDFPNYPTGVYRMKNLNMSTKRQVYCDMTTAGGGWMLLFQRRGGYTNIENCGNNLNDFLQNDCGDVNNLDFYNSYSSNVNKTINEVGANKYLIIQKSYNGDISSDSYIINSVNNLFPNTIGNLQEINYQKICNINGDNCDITNGVWLYAGTSWFNNAICNGGYNGTTNYKGNYGYCHNGLGNYSANSLFGNRNGYAETKLWGLDDKSVNYKEMVFIKNTTDTIKPKITSHFPEENNIIPGKKTKIEIKYTDDNSGINSNSIKIKLYKSDNSGNFEIKNILNNHTNSSNINLTNSSILINLDNLNYGKYKYSFEISDYAGNTSSIEKIFYIDFPELVLNKNLIDLGNLKENNKKFSDILNIKVKTIGAAFKLYIKNEKNPTNGIYSLQDWNEIKGYGYNIDNSTNINSFSGTTSIKIAEKNKVLNNFGTLNTYNYNLKVGELLKDLLPAGKYEGKIGFQIFFKY